MIFGLRQHIFPPWAQKEGGGGAPPPGGFSIRRLPFRGAKRARCKSYLGTLAKLLSFIWQVSQFWPQKFLYPSLNLFPGGGVTAGPPQKSGKVCFFRLFGGFFRLPKRVSNSTTKKNVKICKKH